MVWIAFVVGFSRIFVSLYFTCISLGLNKTVPVSQRATMNGIQVMGGSVARALGPIFAGWLTTLTLKSFSTMQASILIFSTIAVIGWAVTSRVWMVRRYALEDDEPGVEIISKAPSTNSL
jgi:MFS family permease